MIELLKSRRSIRKYEDREIEKEKMDMLLKAALLSPSSKGKRCWEFIAITDKNLLKKLSESKEIGSKFLEDAPLGIVVIGDKESCDVWVEDTSIAATIIHLTAHSIGLGSCWIQIRERMKNKEEKAGSYVKELLNIPDKYSVECIISVGYPAEDRKPYDDSDLMYNKLHFNGYDTNR